MLQLIPFLGLALFFENVRTSKTMLLAVWSKAWLCSCSFAGIAGLNPTGAWVSVSCEVCMFSGRGLCDGAVTRSEESYEVWCV